MKKRFKRREKKEAMDIDITSLLDILVILLVFLLKSYNASNLKLNLVDKLELPNSDTRVLGQHSVIVQVDNEKSVWVNNEKTTDTLEGGAQQLDELFTKLKDLKEKEKLKPLVAQTKSINLVFDKKLPYDSIKKVMHTSSLAGYSEFKLIVKGNY